MKTKLLRKLRKEYSISEVVEVKDLRFNHYPEGKHMSYPKEKIDMPDVSVSTFIVWEGDVRFAEFCASDCLYTEYNEEIGKDLIEVTRRNGGLLNAYSEILRRFKRICLDKHRSLRRTRRKRREKIDAERMRLDNIAKEQELKKEREFKKKTKIRWN